MDWRDTQSHDVNVKYTSHDVTAFCSSSSSCQHQTPVVQYSYCITARQRLSQSVSPALLVPSRRHDACLQSSVAAATYALTSTNNSLRYSSLLMSLFALRLFHPLNNIKLIWSVHHAEMTTSYERLVLRATCLVNASLWSDVAFAYVMRINVNVGS